MWMMRLVDYFHDYYGALVLTSDQAIELQTPSMKAKKNCKTIKPGTLGRESNKETYREHKYAYRKWLRQYQFVRRYDRGRGGQPTSLVGVSIVLPNGQQSNLKSICH